MSGAPRPPPKEPRSTTAVTHASTFSPTTEAAVMSAKQQHQRRRSNTSNASAETWHTLENFLNQEPGAPGSSSNARGSSLYPGGDATVEEASNEAHESDVESKGSGTTQKSKTSTASTAATAVLVTDENGNPIPTEGSKDLTSVASTSMTSKESKPDDFKEHEFKTGLTMFLISNMWIVHLFVICGFSWIMTMYVPQFYIDDEMWNVGCWWKIGYLLPLPYTIVCFIGLILPYPVPRKSDPVMERMFKTRDVDNLYIVIVTRGSNKEAVYRSYHSMLHLEDIHPSVRVHVLTDEPYNYPDINCWSCPKNFTSGKSKYKARALEWYRQTLKLTDKDWILHLDEESVIDAYGVRRVLEFIWFTNFDMGQGPIFYNQHRYWTNPFYTVGDAIRVGDDLSRFHLQYNYFRRPFFGAHGSFLLNNGKVENDVTWDLASLTEDFEFAVNAWEKGYRCGSVPAIIREQSPQRMIDFLKQRRRWYVGIRRLPRFLPKLWAFFWTLGTLALYFTIASVFLGIFIPMGTPRWLGALKDFIFVTFVYLYVLGMFIQDIDYGFWAIRAILQIPVTVVMQFACVVMECVAIMYALVSPPQGFDIIKK